MAAVEKWLFTLLSLSFFSLLLFLTAISGFTASSVLFPHHHHDHNTLSPPRAFRGPRSLPAFAYYISGGHGDARRLYRLLLAVYHPRNRYLLHLSADAADSERRELAASVMAGIPAAEAFRNVDVMGRGDAVTSLGSSRLAATLHAAAVLIRLDGGWDWFITLSAADYPLLTQDDLIYVFSTVPRNLNFIEHTGELGWKEFQRVHPIIVDPGIYLARRSRIFYASEKRTTPDAFKIFTGSSWVVLSRSFIEYCIVGWENLPRSLLLYFTNMQLSEEGYFHSVACNSPDFRNYTVNSDLRYMVWDNPPGMEPRYLNATDYDRISASGIPFARKFQEFDGVLDTIDVEILRRRRHHWTVPGLWCSKNRGWGWSDPCSRWGDVDSVKPGRRGEKFFGLMTRILDDWRSRVGLCK